MGAFVLAGAVLAIALCIAGLQFLALASMPAPSMSSINPVPTVVIGLVLAFLIAASHWLPHIGW